MADLIADLRATQIRSTASQNRALYDERLRKLEELLHTLKGQACDLASVAFNADFALIASDGTKVLARRSVLCAKSSYFQRMLQEHPDSAEAQAGEVIAKIGDGTRVSVAALRCLMALLYGQQHGESTESGVLLEICELATLWQLNSIMDSISSMLLRRASACAQTACEMLATAQRHVEADGTSEMWKSLRDAAAQGVAKAGSALSGVPTFKQLDISAICEVLTHIKAECIELPTLDVDTSSGPWKAKDERIYGTGVDVSWLQCQHSQVKSCIYAKQTQEGALCLGISVKYNCRGIVTGQRSLWAKHSQDGQQKRCQKLLTTGVLGSSRGLTSFLTAEKLPSYTFDGKIHCGGTVTVHSTQRKYELFNMWLVASERTKQTLSPVETLQCLRGCVTACDVNGASTADLQSMLAQRGLSTTGGKGTLQVRLRDVAYAEVPRDSAAAKVAKQFAAVAAQHYGRHTAGNLKDLDAASVCLPTPREHVHHMHEIALDVSNMSMMHGCARSRHLCAHHVVLVIRSCARSSPTCSFAKICTSATRST